MGNTAIESLSYLMQRAKLFAYVNNNIDIKRILQDKQFHLEQKEIIQNVLERKDSMAVLPTGFGKSMCYVLSTPFWTRYMGDDLHINKQTNICIVNHRRLLRQNN
jgi:hypothetical protein